MALSVEEYDRIKVEEGLLKPESRRSYEKCIRAYLAWLAAMKKKGKNYLEPNDDNAKEFLLKLRSDGKKASTLVLYRNSLKSYFDAMGHELKHVKLPSAKLGPPKYYTENDFKKLYEAATTPLDKAMVSVDYSTAMRLCELRTRKLRDFDIANAKEASVFVAGKTEEDSDAYIPLMPSAVRDLRAYIASLPFALGPDDYVFHKEGQPQVPIPDSTARDHFYELKRTAGITDDGAWHRVRHSRGTHLRDKDVPLVDIQALLRHKDPEMTMRYARSTSKHLRKKTEGTDIL